MKKLVFLDFDGVLHPTSAPAVLLFSKSELLGTALVSDCDVVISSSWRFSHSLDALKQLLPVAVSSHVVGVTGPAYVGRHARHREILEYLRSVGHQGGWRALDDSAWEFPHCPELIRCDPNIGLTALEARILKAWLLSD